MTSTAPAERQRRARSKRVAVPRQNLAALSREPADLTLEDYRRVDLGVVAQLIAAFGDAGALRILNSKPRESNEQPVPFDPALLAPAGAIGIPRSDGRRWRSEGRG